MPKNMSTSYAKNTIRKSLQSTIDPELKDKERKAIWQYFDSSCAYCNKKLDKKKREGHMDHLVSDGPNHISNRVLSCGPCNGDEKREADWEEFLTEKCVEKSVYEQRHLKIKMWVNSHSDFKLEEDHQRILNEEIEKVFTTFDNAVKRLRKLNPKGKAIFTKQEADTILPLIRLKVIADTKKQKVLRAKIRKLGFYAEDFDLYGGYTEHDFLRVVRILPSTETHHE